MFVLKRYSGCRPIAWCLERSREYEETRSMDGRRQEETSKWRRKSGEDGNDDERGGETKEESGNREHGR